MNKQILHARLGIAIKDMKTTEIVKLINVSRDLGLKIEGKVKSRLEKEYPHLVEESSHCKEDLSSEFEKPFDVRLAELYLYKFQSCQERGIEWALSLSDLKRLMKRKKCAYSGLAFDNGNMRATLERIDSSQGYTKENTIVVGRKFNHIKGMLFENPRNSLSSSIKEIETFLYNLRKLNGS